MHAKTLSASDFVWLTGSLCQINRIPFDPQLLRQRFPGPHDVRQFIEAIRSLGFKTGEASAPRPRAWPVSCFPASVS